MTITIHSNRGDVAKVNDYRRKQRIVEIDRAVLKSLGKRRGFEPPDYWTHAVVDGEKHLIRGVH